MAMMRTSERKEYIEMPLCGRTSNLKAGT